MAQSRRRPNRIATPRSADTFGSSRAGARNIAGVHYQAMVTSHLLLDEAGRGVTSVRPEGDEDCDVFLAARGDPLRVEVKFRSDGLSVSELGLALIKAWESAASTEADLRQIAICTNLSSGRIPISGWHRSIAEALSEDSRLGAHRANLVTAMRAAAGGNGIDLDPDVILARSHLVHINSGFSDLVKVVAQHHQFSTELHAQLAASRVLERVLSVASENRHTNRETAKVLTRHNLTEVMTSVTEATGSWIHAIEARRLVTVPDFTRLPAETRSAFLRGLRARPQHVGAGYPLPRPRWLRQVQQVLDTGSSALLVGPSGSGKSTLMWQAAHDSQQTKVFVLEQAALADVTELASFFRLMAPAEGSPVLICAEDIDRRELDGWAALLRELASDAQVQMIGTCREDAFVPAFTATGSATIVRPRLDPDEAIEMGRELFGNQPRSQADVEVLHHDSHGLLLEFVHLATTSSHLADVVAEQADGLLDRDPVLAAVARLVVAADVCGVRLQAEQLRVLDYSDAAISAALTILDGEHIIIEDSGSLHGLHPRRSRYLLTYLHRGLPRLAESLALLTRIALAEDLRTLVRTWIRLAPDDVELLEKSLAARIDSDHSLSAREITDLLYGCEAGLYASTVNRLLSPRDADLKQAVLLGGMAGRDQGMRLLTAGVWDAPLGGQQMQNSLPLMTRYDKLHEQIPRPRAFRRNVIVQLTQARDRLIQKLPTDLKALQNLVASEAFTAVELDRIILDCVTTWDTPHPRNEVTYPPASSAGIILATNRRMAAKTVAAAARLSAIGPESSGRVLGTDHGDRVRWMLDRSTILIDPGSPDDRWPTVTLLAPALDVAPHQFDTHFSPRLSDAAVVAGLSSVEAILVSADGQQLDEGTGGRLSGSAPGPIPEHILGRVLAEDALLTVHDSWFDWLQRTDSAVRAAVATCELTVSVCVEALKRPPSPQTLRRLSDQFRQAEKILAIPLGFPPTRHPGSLDTSPTVDPGFVIAPEDAARLLGQTLNQFISLCSFAGNLVIGQESDEVPNQIDASAMWTSSLLREATTFMQSFRGTALQAQLGRLTAALSALQAVASCLTSRATVSRAALEAVAASRSDPERGVQLVLSAVERVHRTRRSYEFDQLSSRLSETSGGWTIVEVEPLGSMHRLPLPSWAIISAPMNRMSLEELDELCSDISGLENRLFTVMTSVDNDWPEDVLVFQKHRIWRPLARVASDVVKHQLHVAGYSPMRSSSIRPPEARQLDTLLPLLSLRLAQARLTDDIMPGLEEWEHDLRRLITGIREPAASAYLRVADAVIAEAERDTPEGLALDIHRHRAGFEAGPSLNDLLAASAAAAG